MNAAMSARVDDGGQASGKVAAATAANSATSSAVAVPISTDIERVGSPVPLGQVRTGVG